MPNTPAADNSGELMKKIQVLEDKLAEYSVETTRELEDAEIKRTAVWSFPT